MAFLTKAFYNIGTLQAQVVSGLSFSSHEPEQA